MLLRDLALHEDDLSRSDRREAKGILARPTDGASDPQDDGYRPGAGVENICRNVDGKPGKDACLHWATATSDAVDPTDSSPSNSVPDYIDDALEETQRVWKREVNRFDFKRPQGDANSNTDGPNGLLDLYFTDLGDDGLYGYCTTDEPDAGDKKRVSAYCVLDNDYDPGQYDAPEPEVSGLDALRVTLAHEFFHAIQFNYDWREAPFLMEGSAVWMEDQIPRYDDINASYAYIFDSVFHQPEIPLDAYDEGDDGENFEYGAFAFFTWLAEDYGEGYPGSDPSIVRAIWDEAGDDRKGFGAVETVVNRRGHWGPSSPFRDFFAGWGAASYYYDSYYEEGWDRDNPETCDSPSDSYFDALRCTRGPYDAHYYLPNDPTTGWKQLPVARRSTRYAKIWSLQVPHELQVKVDLPRHKRGGEATVVIQRQDFTVIYYRIDLNAEGNGQRTFDLAGTDQEFMLVLSNSGPRGSRAFKYNVKAVPQ